MIFCYGDVGSTLLEIPRLLGALVVAQVAGLVRWLFFSFFDFEVNRTRGFYFPSAVASSKMPGGFLVSSGGVGQKGFFFAVCFFLFGGFLDRCFERYSEVN